jgi:hypothetical protein
MVVQAVAVVVLVVVMLVPVVKETLAATHHQKVITAVQVIRRVSVVLVQVVAVQAQPQEMHPTKQHLLVVLALPTQSQE